MRLSIVFFFFSSRRRHTRYIGDWSSDVCSSDLMLHRLSEFGPGDRVIIREAQDDNPARLRRWQEQGRSEERRVGKECRSRWSREHWKKKKQYREKSIIAVK